MCCSRRERHSVSAPTTEEICELPILERLELFERFTIRYYGSEQLFDLSTAQESFRVRLTSTGLPMFVDYPVDGIHIDKDAVTPKHLRIREGRVVLPKVTYGHYVGYDLAQDTIVAYDNKHKVCWRSRPIVKIVRVIVQL